MDTTNSRSPCVLCGKNAEELGALGSSTIFRFKCPSCGKFAATMSVEGIHISERWKISAYAKEKEIHGGQAVLFSSQDQVSAQAPAGSVGLDTARDSFPRSVAEILDRALLNLAAISGYLGDTIKLTTDDYPILFARNLDEMSFVLEQLVSDGYVRGHPTVFPSDVRVTAKGMNRVAELQRGLSGYMNKQVFVAMSFDKSLDDAWGNGLKPGIEDCGYEALRVDLKQHNENICDVIVSEIRKSKFLVADFTLHRNGVYFEAGLMMGLGRPVIFTCKKDELEKAHFDTRQYNHISWVTPTELREKLKRRIQATIPP